jgi:hypothetical protein
MRELFVIGLTVALLSAPLSFGACQSTTTRNPSDAGMGGGTSGGLDGGPGSIPLANDAGVCNDECTLGQFCASTGQCIDCRSDADCAGSESGSHCDTRPGAMELFGTCVACVQGSQCGSALSCDPSSDTCVPTCTTASCTATSLICDPTSGACVDCVRNADCASTGQLCDPVTLVCIDCLQPSDCPTGSPGCYQGVCGQCNVTGDCPTGEICQSGSCTCDEDEACPALTPICILDGGFGVCGCTGDGSCASAGLICDPDQGFAGSCVQSCSTDGGVCLAAGTGQSFCDTSSGLCVQCLTSAQCTEPSSPFCLAGACVQCDSDSNCEDLGADGGPLYCSMSLGRCVGCTSPADCNNPTLPGCNSVTNNCGSCALNADCPAGVGCGLLSGVCVAFCGTAAAVGAADCAGCTNPVDCGGASCDIDAGVCGQ